MKSIETIYTFAKTYQEKEDNTHRTLVKIAGMGSMLAGVYHAGNLLPVPQHNNIPPQVKELAGLEQALITINHYKHPINAQYQTQLEERIEELKQTKEVLLYNKEQEINWEQSMSAVKSGASTTLVFALGIYAVGSFVRRQILKRKLRDFVGLVDESTRYN